MCCPRLVRADPRLSAAPTELGHVRDVRELKQFKHRKKSYEILDLSGCPRRKRWNLLSADDRE